MIALGIVLAHLVGDYLIQSHWMATEKTRRWWPAIAHGITYTLPYALVTQSWAALIVIAGTHMIIDRYRLAKHVVWLKNLAMDGRLAHDHRRQHHPLAHQHRCGVVAMTTPSMRRGDPDTEREHEMKIIELIEQDSIGWGEDL